jgi:hypothetical protein
MGEFMSLLCIGSFVGVSYLLGRVWALERQVKALNWTIEKHYEWLQLLSVDLARLKTVHRPTPEGMIQVWPETND